MMSFNSILDDVSRLIEDAKDGVTGLYEPVVRLGVTGLSRSGKTVFITSLVHNLLHPNGLKALKAASNGRIEAVTLSPPDDRQTPLFPYEKHMKLLSNDQPEWPESTRWISQIRISIRYKSENYIKGMLGSSYLHIDVLDYPGEWLLDLALLEQSFEDWSAAMFDCAAMDVFSDWLAAVNQLNQDADYNENDTARLASLYTNALSDAVHSGFSNASPGRFLMPGDLEGSPVLTFCPLPIGSKNLSRGSFYSEMKKRFDAYKRTIAKPFFRDHFSRIDRQIVLIDALTAYSNGEDAVEGLTSAMEGVLSAFRPGENSWLSSILGRRVEKILFAATKADHIHHTQHTALTDVTKSMVDTAMRRAAFKGADVTAMTIASLRSTSEQDITKDGLKLSCIRGKVHQESDVKKIREVAVYAGELVDKTVKIYNFEPPEIDQTQTLPHIRLDRAIQFLIGDRM